MGNSIAVLTEMGVDFEETNLFTNSPDVSETLHITTLSIPSQIVDQVKAEPLIDLFDITDRKTFNGQILRTKKLVFHPKGELLWSIPDVSDLGDFVAICGEELVLNTPTTMADLAILNLLDPFNGKAPNGPNISAAASGWSGPDGSHGTNGTDGFMGSKGETFNFPIVYMFFQKITINNANPTITSALKLIGKGVVGGDGSQGGNGGNGGNGARGTSGETKNLGDFIPIKVCAAGPGRGGNGGNSGRGGKGGKAGRGGKGASISLVGPTAYFTQLNNVQFLITGATAGNPGQPGQSGQPGQAGGGGSKPFECPQGAESGSPGNFPNPRDFGIGDTNFDGIDGSLFTIVRDNSDLF
jgi:hypothetical protein